MKEKEKQVSENGNKVVWKGPKLGIVIVVGVLLIILLGMQVFASTNGYGNVFFMIKELVTTGSLQGESEIFSDKEITLSYKSIEIAEGVKLQANKLEIKENESTLCLHITADDKNTVLPLTYEWMSEGLKKTEVKGSKSTKGDFDERLTVKYTFVDDELMTLFVKDKDGKLLRELEINLGTHEIYVNGESEVEKISQIELKKYLNLFSELNNVTGENETLIMVADGIWDKILNYRDAHTREDVNSIIKEFYGDKATFEKTKDSKGNEVEVLKFEKDSGYVYEPDFDNYIAAAEFNEYQFGICLKIKDISFENGVYTVKYIYTLAKYEDIDKERIEELPQYEATIKLKVNENAKYSKYQVVELSKGIEVKEKVNTDVVENNDTIEKNLEGVWTDKREGEGFYHNGIIKITNQTADSIDFELSATNGRDVDHVNIGEVSGTAKKVGNEYIFEEKREEYESKITIYLGDFEGTKAVVVRENYSTENNPYAGHGVWFDGEYTKENQNNTDTNKNTEESVVKEFNTPQLNKNLSNIKERAIKTFDISEPGMIKYEYDFNNDGTEEKLTIAKKDYDDCKIYCNNKNCLNEFYVVDKVYIVDLDENDESIDLVLSADVASDDWAFIICKFTGNAFENLNDNAIMGEEMYIDGQGTALVQNGAYVGTNPIISNAYFDYKENKEKELNADKLQGMLITFNDVYFTEDVNNISKYHEYAGNMNFDEAIEKANIKKYDSVKCYVKNVSVSTDKIEVELEDGTRGYLFVANGNFAG